MKFSWQLTNNFINLKDLTINEFQENLTLSGIEIEKIETIKQERDITIELSITANRKEINSTLSLAREISTIFKLPIRITPIKLNYTNRIAYNKKHLCQTKHNQISYIRVILLNNIKQKQTPEWLLHQLQIHDIHHKETLNNIQEYIKIKWGHTFYIININNDKTQVKKDLIKITNSLKQFNITELNVIINKITRQKQKDSKSKLIVFTTKQPTNNKENLNYDNNEFYENFYIDSIKLIGTLTGVSIGKYSEAFKTIINENTIIKVRKNNVNKSLGYIRNRTFKFITTDKIINILNQLKLSPKYDSKEQSFNITVPNYRKHDLKREIDIIEEIGRIYQFKSFFKEVKKHNLTGIQSENFLKIKKLRHTLRSLGLHEVVNSCLTTNITNNMINTKIYNPINNEQTHLKTNIIENLIQNYKHNIKHSQNTIEIFEISKIFEANNITTRQYVEKRHIGGLIYNTNYSRHSWENKPHNTNLFHFKGIIETFLERINSDTIIKEILKNDNKKYIKHLEHLFKKDRRIGIYSQNNNTIIGIIGELNNNNIINSNKQIYAFEFNLNELIKTTNKQRNLNYIIKKYSNYPHVSRDISIESIKNLSIDQIKQILLKHNKELIESLYVFNEYKDESNKKKRAVGLRLIYRSYVRTLNNKDIQLIDTNLESAIKEIEQV
uniref:phenylalanine--tRNA ligase n=1 Tax=Dipterosiphonia australica TaxID=2007208 RepID=A0A1Z1MLH0_9FLOR|nr:Phenylalanine-tRNA ligase beta subunit [Dipterosiphonia australica]ARW66923.1 Phenylalanine-tRNA ligase beta subunit [Dipterosiphonia australica]